MGDFEDYIEDRVEEGDSGVLFKWATILLLILVCCSLGGYYFITLPQLNSLETQNKQLISENERLTELLVECGLTDEGLDYCPVCESEVTVETCLSDFYAKCENCGIKSPSYDSIDELIQEWNTLDEK